MSFSLPVRALESLHAKSGASLWRASFQQVLSSNVSPTVMRRSMERFEGAVPSSVQMQDRWRELTTIDLSPTGRMMWHATSQKSIAHVWHAYNTHVELIDRARYTAHGLRPGGTVSRVHALVLDAYQALFEFALTRNRRDGRTPTARTGFDLQDLARILDAPSLVRDACDFFDCFPHAKVVDLYGGLGLHPRTAERRFAAEGITAVAIKRACALSSATRYVLWSEHTLAEIAARFGYTDASHLHHEFRRSTGGIPPSVYRQAAQMMR